MQVAVAWASGEQQMLRALDLPDGACVADALALLHSELTRADPRLVECIDWTGAAVGIHGEIRDRAALLHGGDRLEIYRPLLLDPKESRRERAQRLRRSSDR